MNFHQKMISKQERNIKLAQKSGDEKAETVHWHERRNYIQLLKQSKGK